MNALTTFWMVGCLVAAASAYRSNAITNNLKPSEWVSVSELDSIPPVNEITFQQLENMSTEDGAELVNKIYHLSQLNQKLKPSYAPSASDIPVYTFSPSGQKTKSNLNQLASSAKQQPNFGQREVTIVITGLPQQCASVQKANQKLIQAYLQLYNGQVQSKNNQDYDYGGANNKNNAPSSSEEDYSMSQQSAQKPNGNLIVVDLGSKIENFQQLVTLDVEHTGAAIGNQIVQLSQQAGVPQEIINIVGQGIGAHVAGAAARQYKRQTGNQVRRITALDPSKLFAKWPNTLVGLARGNADFVDAIHTSAYGLGTATRVGSVDFFPNGPSVAVPGAKNQIEACMRATRYFAESLLPGKERNFPAVAADSLQQYKSKNGYGQRTYMGIGADYDVEGDYILQVNAQSPFGKKEPAQKQNSAQGGHGNSGSRQSQDYN